MTEQREPLYIGLAGFGTVGGGLCRLLEDNADIIKKRAGREIIVKTILVRNAAKKRDIAPPAGASLTTAQDDLINDPRIGAIVELMGGMDAARQLLESALRAGKHVVTANKALLAEHGMELFHKAREKNRILRYEASVAGAIPVVAALRESLTGNRVSSLVGILNGTSNYILSEMASNGLEFDVALRQAQELGFAEADPSLDIDGLDAAHKLTVLIRLAFGLNYPFPKLPVRGIRNLAAMDIRLAAEFGYAIKLIGQVRALPRAHDPARERLAAGVFPALVHHSLLLAKVGGSYNALRVGANAAGPLFFHGKGAGALPTAGAVLADLIAVAIGESPNNTGFAAAELPEAEIMPDEEWLSRYYVRVMVADAPGVLRDISGCMAAEDISVAQMIQKEEVPAIGVPLVFMTHETSERAMKDALDRANTAGLLREPPVWFRVLERERAL